MRGEDPYAAIIVGASAAGCAAATLFGDAGFRTLLLEKRSGSTFYKKVCTHFVQPSAMGTIRRLGLQSAFERAGAVANRLEAWTEAGWIRGDDLAHGYNIRRETLDPLLRAHVKRRPSVTVLEGHDVVGLINDGDQVVGVTTQTSSGERHRFFGRLVIGADGRNSRVAALADIPAQTSRNDRATYFTYYKGLKLSFGANSQYWLLGHNLAYAFVNDAQTTLLGIWVGVHQLDEFRGNALRRFEAFWQEVPGGPDLRAAERCCELRGMVSIPNLRRKPHAPGLALIGDAALALDPIWGTGIGFAFESAEQLFDAVVDSLRRPAGVSKLAGPLAAYARAHRRRTGGHAWHMRDFSHYRPLRWVERVLLSAGAQDRVLARRVLRYLSREDSFADFVAPRNVARGLAVNLISRWRRSLPQPALDTQEGKYGD